MSSLGSKSLNPLKEVGDPTGTCNNSCGSKGTVSRAPSFGNPSGVLEAITRLEPTRQEPLGPANVGRNDCSLNKDEVEPAADRTDELVLTESESLHSDLPCLLLPLSAIWPWPSQNRSKRKKYKSKCSKVTTVLSCSIFRKVSFNKWQNAAVDSAECTPTSANTAETYRGRLQMDRAILHH